MAGFLRRFISFINLTTNFASQSNFMHSKIKNNQLHQVSQIKIEASLNAMVDFNSAAIKQQLDEVKKEVKAVLAGASIDAKKLNLSFTV
jgi:hypothetical protein